MYKVLTGLLFIASSLNAELKKEEADPLLNNPNWQEEITVDDQVYFANLHANASNGPSEVFKLDRSKRLPKWLIDTSISNMPLLLRGIHNYLKHHDLSYIIPSCHRFILVGDPGVGKTTMAYAMAYDLGYDIEFVHASSLFGRYRNQTAVNLRERFDRIKKVKHNVILIIDEIHKLFENHEHERTDDAANATAFWNQLDEIEKHNQNIVVIGTANSIDKLPPELKSRFHGKIIEMPLPNIAQRRDAFKSMLVNDNSIRLGLSADEAYFNSLNKFLVL